VYDTAKSAEAGAVPGPTVIRITGFDGKKLPYYPQGKQIFNPYELRDKIAEGVATRDFDVPASAANNLKVEPTATCRDASLQASRNGSDTKQNWCISGSAGRKPACFRPALSSPWVRPTKMNN